MVKTSHISMFETLQHAAIRLGVSGFEEEHKGILTEMRERDSAIVKITEAEAKKK